MLQRSTIINCRIFSYRNDKKTTCTLVFKCCAKDLLSKKSNACHFIECGENCISNFETLSAQALDCSEQFCRRFSTETFPWSLAPTCASSVFENQLFQFSFSFFLFYGCYKKIVDSKKMQKAIFNQCI